MATFLEALKKNPYVYIVGTETRRVLGRLAREARHNTWKRGRTESIREYLAASAVPKLHIGCGPMLLRGWINSDMEPDIAKGVIYLDVTEPLPFPDGSLNYIYSEHVLEHVTLETTFTHFGECYRALSPGGVIRVAMPDLQFLLDYFKGKELTPVQQSFLERTVEKFHPMVAVKSPALLLNDFVRRWGHQVIYDHQLLADLLKRVGFDPVVSCALQESRHTDLTNLEHHGTAIGDAYNRLQTMVLEATRPAM